MVLLIFMDLATFQMKSIPSDVNIMTPILFHMVLKYQPRFCSAGRKTKLYNSKAKSSGRFSLSFFNIKIAVKLTFSHPLQCHQSVSFVISAYESGGYFERHHQQVPMEMILASYKRDDLFSFPKFAD